MLQIHQLAKSFSVRGGDVWAVRDLSFSVVPGEIFALLGPNGAGKTTTLRMILGLLRPTSGDVLLEGLDVTSQADEVKRRIGLVSASAGLYPWLTPRETLDYFAELYAVPLKIRPERIAVVSELMELAGILDRRCSVLSTGQKQRVNLARALIHDPPCLLLDEPTRGLDIVGTQVVFEYLARMRALGKAIVVCTHRLDEAERLADRFGLMHQGRMRFSGTIDEVRSASGCGSLVEIFVRLLREEPVEQGSRE